jgi:hypothetical protein
MQQTSSTHTVSIECSGPELFFLAALLGGRALIGVENPFSGRLTEEIEQEMSAVQAALAARRYLRRLPDGRLQLDEIVALVVAVVTYPSAIALATRSSDPGAEQRYYYVRRPSVVELSRPEQDGRYRLAAMTGIPPAVQRMRQLWQLKGDEPAVDAGTLELREGVVQRAAGAGKSGDVAQVRAILNRQILPGADLDALAQSLAGLQQNGAVVVMRPDQGPWQLEGFALLGGENGLWQLRTSYPDGPGTEGLVSARPRSAPDLLQEAQALIEQSAPASPGALPFTMGGPAPGQSNVVPARPVPDSQSGNALTSGAGAAAPRGEA